MSVDKKISPAGGVTHSNPNPEFESAALAVQNCLGRCKFGLAKVDMFCGTAISIQFLEVEKVYNDIIYLSSQGGGGYLASDLQDDALSSQLEPENKDLESAEPRSESADIKKRLEKLEEAIMGTGAAVVAENSKLKEELSTVLLYIQRLIQNKEEEVRERVSGTQETTLSGGKSPQPPTNGSEHNKEEVIIDITTIKLYQECSSTLSILNAISNPLDMSFNQTNGEYQKSILELLDFAKGRVHDRRPKVETELQEHYALVDELSTLIDKVVDLGAALDVDVAPTSA
jgi:hypothetical protein